MKDLRPAECKHFPSDATLAERARHAALVAAAREVVNAYMGPAEYGLLREAHILALRAALDGEPS
jgi:hypothetical protein